MNFPRISLALTHLTLAGVLVTSASAQLFNTPLLKENAGRDANGGIPVQNAEGIGIEQKLEGTPDLDVAFLDQDGKTVRFRDLCDGTKPVLVTFNFSDCPSVCSAQLQMLAGALGQIDLVPGQQFKIATISLDHNEDPEKSSNGRKRYLEEVKKANADWTFLRVANQDEAQLRKFTNSCGYSFKWTDDVNKIAHIPVVMFLTPTGKIARYIGGVTYESLALRMSIVEASDGKIGGLYEDVFLMCFYFDPTLKSYVLFANNFMKVGGTLALLALGWFFWRMFKYERVRTTSSAPAEVTNG